MKHLMVILLPVLLLCSVGFVYAQDGDGTADQITDAYINYGDEVSDTITAKSVYDWWRFLGNEGETIHVTMVAADGLAPLVGISGDGGGIIARSDATSDGLLVDAQVNGIAELVFTIPSNGEFKIVATRVGNFDGITTGSYTLSLNVDVPAVPKDLQDVVFRCDEYELTTAATVEFSGEGDEDNYRITVYGMDGFQPYFRFNLPINGGTTTCSSDGNSTIGDIYTLPDAAPVTVTGDSPETAQYTLQRMKEYGQIIFTLGSRDGKPGRYVMLIEGYGIAPAGDEDVINVRLGPLASSSKMMVYMLRSSDGRIDPQIEMIVDSLAFDFTCDDAGRRACADVPAANLYSFTLNDGTKITGEHLDAGVLVSPGNPDRVQIHFRSRTATTEGNYTIMIIGELPSSETP